MKLNEWQYMNKPTGSATNNSSSSGYKKRFEKLIKYHIDHASSELERVTAKDIRDNYFRLGEHYNTGLSEFDRDIIVSYDKDSNTLMLRVFVDSKEVYSTLCYSYEELVEVAAAYMYLPDSFTPEYNDLLTEWVAMKNTSNSSSPPANSSPSKPKSQVKRYSRLTQQIDVDGLCTNRRTNKFNDTILDITLNTAKTKDLNLRIVYDPVDDDYELLANGRTTLSGCDYEEDILPILIAGGIISNTNLCESASSIADDFKTYENLWD